MSSASDDYDGDVIVSSTTESSEGSFRTTATIVSFLDLFTIPQMSSECERMFSQDKRTYGLQSHRIYENTINMVECLK